MDYFEFDFAKQKGGVVGGCIVYIWMTRRKEFLFFPDYMIFSFHLDRGLFFAWLNIIIIIIIVIIVIIGIIFIIVICLPKCSIIYNVLIYLIFFFLLYGPWYYLRNNSHPWKFNLNDN